MALRSGCEAHCPGCRHRTLSGDDSLRQKYQFLASQLEPWQAQLQPVASVTGEQRWGYRDRVQLSCAWQQGWRAGLRRRDELIPIPHCPVQSPRVRRALALLLPLLPPPEQDFQLAYWVQSGAQLVLVLKQAALPECPWLSAHLWAQLQHLGIEGLWLHLHPSAGRKVLAKPGWHLLRGAAYSRDASGLIHGPAAFQQLLPQLFNQALDCAETFLQPSASTRVLDLYSGSGSSLRRWHQHGAAVLGVEISAAAIDCAARNVPEAPILRGSCENRLPQLEQWRRENSNAHYLLYTNPPRTGMESAVTDWVAQQLRPTRIAYLSCSAGTLARDLAQLTASGYRVETLQPFDFFPQTHHVETLALLQREG
nr:hypothetical protein [Motiliproteus sediminis]